ncbi:MAG: deoxynucleoside kinase [Bacteroidia bacterium]|jgi:deoxyadenosine/deoxycytidine kinase|nr:deoxynucleoside kinase [Bacteroidia bacterium]
MTSIPYTYIAVEGNIGAGKTTLTHLLARELGAAPVLEEFADNPFLAPFYNDPARYALPLELSFLEERFRQQKQALSGEGRLISDYLWEKSYVFAGVNLEGAEWELFQRFYRHLAGQLRPPDLVIYLHRSTLRLKQQIGMRGRSYEQNIPADYLDKVSAGYHRFFVEEQRMPVLWIEENDEKPVSAEVLAKYILSIISNQRPPGLHPIVAHF